MQKAIVNICTYKRPGMLQKCLESILRQQIPPDWQVEVVVVDNDASSSPPKPMETVPTQAIQVHYVIEPHPGIPFARNSACRESLRHHADWLLFIDDDEEAEPGWLLAYHKASKELQADAYSGPVRYIFPPGYAEWLENKGMRELDYGTFLDRASTNNVMLSSELLMGTQTRLEFDTEMAFSGGSDTDFFRRLTHQGGSIVFVSDAVVSEAVQSNRLSLFWRLKRQYRSSANSIYIDFKLYGVKRTLGRSLRELLRRLIEGTLRLLTSPLGFLDGYLRFKRNVYHGLRHYAKVAGIVAGLVGKHPQPYMHTDGH